MEWKTIDETFIFVRNGKSIKQFGEEGYPITRIETIADRYVDETRVGYASIYKLEEYEDYILQKGDILMSHINSVKHLAKTAIFNSDSILIHGMNLLCLRADKNIIDPYYGYYYLNSDIFLKQIPQITKNSVNQASFSITNLKRLQIPVPPVEIQKKIVEVLDEAQKLIDNRKKQIKLLDDLIESIFYDMFGDPVKNDKEWEVKKLGELSSLITKGASPNWQGIEYVDDDSQTLFITSENVREGYLDLSKRKYLQDEFNEKQKRSILKKGDFLINIVGASIGRVAQFNMEVKANINQAVSLVRLENKDIDDKYLLVFLNSESALAQYEKMKVSVARANLSLQNIKDLQIPIPPLPLQNQFAEKVKAIEKQKELLQESLKLMEDNYNSLMQRAFKGELF